MIVAFERLYINVTGFKDVSHISEGLGSRIARKRYKNRLYTNAFSTKNSAIMR